MKKTIFSLSAALMLGGGLAGCNAGDNQAIDNNTDTRPIGFYTNEDNRDNDLGMRNRDNGEGPMTDMMDRDGNNNNNNGRINYRNGTGNNADLNDDRITENAPNNSYFNNNGGEKAEQIANRVGGMKNIEDARAIVTNDKVLVGVHTQDQADQNLNASIRNTVRTMVKGKDIHVTTDENMYNRIRTIDDDLQDGRAMNEVNSDINGIVNDIGNAAERPFENNQ